MFRTIFMTWIVLAEAQQHAGRRELAHGGSSYAGMGRLGSSPLASWIHMWVGTRDVSALPNEEYVGQYVFVDCKAYDCVAPSGRRELIHFANFATRTRVKPDPSASVSDPCDITTVISSGFLPTNTNVIGVVTWAWVRECAWPTNFNALTTFRSAGFNAIAFAEQAGNEGTASLYAVFYNNLAGGEATPNPVPDMPVFTIGGKYGLFQNNSNNLNLQMTLNNRDVNWFCGVLMKQFYSTSSHQFATAVSIFNVIWIVVMIVGMVLKKFQATTLFLSMLFVEGLILCPLQLFNTVKFFRICVDLSGNIVGSFYSSFFLYSFGIPFIVGGDFILCVAWVNVLLRKPLGTKAQMVGVALALLWILLTFIPILHYGFFPESQTNLQANNPIANNAVNTAFKACAYGVFGFVGLLVLFTARLLYALLKLQATKNNPALKRTVRLLVVWSAAIAGNQLFAAVKFNNNQNVDRPSRQISTLIDATLKLLFASHLALPSSSS